MEITGSLIDASTEWFLRKLSPIIPGFGPSILCVTARLITIEEKPESKMRKQLSFIRWKKTVSSFLKGKL